MFCQLLAHLLASVAAEFVITAVILDAFLDIDRLRGESMVEWVDTINGICFLVHGTSLLVFDSEQARLFAQSDIDLDRTVLGLEPLASFVHWVTGLWGFALALLGVEPALFSLIKMIVKRLHILGLSRGLAVAFCGL